MTMPTHEQYVIEHERNEMLRQIGEQMVLQTVSLERIAEAIEALGVVVATPARVSVVNSARLSARKASMARLADDRHSRLCPARLNLGECNCPVRFEDA